VEIDVAGRNTAEIPQLVSVISIGRVLWMLEKADISPTLAQRKMRAPSSDFSLHQRRGDVGLFEHPQYPPDGDDGYELWYFGCVPTSYVNLHSSTPTSTHKFRIRYRIGFKMRNKGSGSFRKHEAISIWARVLPRR
jgi:hypothetical protein